MQREPCTNPLFAASQTSGSGPRSSAPPRGTGDNSRREHELTSDIDADLTPFPSCYYPPGGTR